MRTYLVVALFVVSVPAVAFAEGSDSTPTSTGDDCCSATALASESSADEGADDFVGADVLFGGTPSYGVYLAPAIEAGRVAQQTGVFFGGRGGLIVSDVLTVGGGINWLLDGPTADAEGRPAIRMRHGGALLGLTLASHQVVHPTIDVLFGGGRVSFDQDRALVSDEQVNVFVLEVASGFDINVTHGIRAHIGGGYRHVSNFQLDSVTDEDLGGFFGSMQLKFGAF